MSGSRGCSRVEVDDSKYSSFVPVIGMYIAVISVVCFLAMLYDILSAFRHKKRWLPCRLFSLNSLTLTLLAIAAKIPVDLTTPMPSALDQSSKLSGNCLICVSMGFLMPSIGLKKKEESLNNMLALSILVVTIVVNTCVQIRTGVIFFFIIEHIIVMCCMLASLLALWSFFEFTANGKDLAIDHNKYCFTKGKGSMLQRLKLAYLFGFSLNPQYFISVGDESVIVAELCLVCSVVLLQALFKRLSLVLCGGSSDYGWSVWVIVLGQVFSVVGGSFATGMRSLGVSSKWRMNFSDCPYASAASEKQANPLLRAGSKGINLCVPFLFLLLTALIFLPLHVALVYLESIFDLVFKREPKQDRDVEKYKNRIADGGEMWSLPERPLTESVKDMKMLKTISKSKSIKSLFELLHTTSPSRPFHAMKISEIYYLNETIEVSSLSVVVLLRIAQVLLPSQLSNSLVQAYSDAYEILHFVEDRMKSISLQKRRKSEAAKALWVGGDFRRLLPHRSQESQFHFIIRNVEDALPQGLVREEALLITKFITDGYSRSTEPIHTLYDFILQLFVDMLHMFLTQLPHAVYKEVTQSTAEGFYESVKASLGILWRIKSLETQIQWSFPVECDICDLTTPRPQDNQLQVVSQEQEQDVMYFFSC